MGPTSINRNVIPGGNATQEVLVENKGSSVLRWTLKLSPGALSVEWLAACASSQCAYAGDPSIHAAVHAQVSSLTSVSL